MKYNTNRTALLILTFLLGSMVALAQGTPNLSGTYEGMVKRPGADAAEKVSIELKSEGGKITGRAVHGPKTVEITEAKFENGTLTLSFDKDHKYIAKVDGDTLTGDLTDGTQKIPIVLKKVTAAAAAPSSTGSVADGPHIPNEARTVYRAAGTDFRVHVSRHRQSFAFPRLGNFRIPLPSS